MPEEKTIPRPVEPSMSIIMVADRYETIRQTIRHLRAQTGREQLELVIVTQSADRLGLDQGETKDFCHVRVVEVAAILPLALATSAGIRCASAPVVVLAESHAFPGAGWAQALIAAHRQPWAAVGAVMGNANPGMISWANLFVDYGRCVEAAVAGITTYLPGHHTAYKREILLQYDLQLEAVWIRKFFSIGTCRPKAISCISSRQPGCTMRTSPRSRRGCRSVFTPVVGLPPRAASPGRW